MPDIFTVDASSLTNLRDKVVLITGGASGIGLATAQLILSLSPTNRVAILDRVPPPSTLATTYPGAGRVFAHQCDLSSWAEQRAGFAAAVAALGRLDAVVANVGINERGQQFFDDARDADGALAEMDRAVMDVTFTANADTVKLAIHHLRRNKRGGNIVMTSSLAGYIGNAGAPFYNAAKHAIIGLLRSLRAETKKLDIAISVVSPAVTVTPMIATTQGGRTLTPEENAARLARTGLSINRVETVALAAGHLINAGLRANGMGILVQGDVMADLEEGYVKSREGWMGLHMLNLYKGGLKADLYPRTKDKAKM